MRFIVCLSVLFFPVFTFSNEIDIFSYDLAELAKIEVKVATKSEVSLRYYRGCTIRITRILVLDVADQLIVVYDRRRLCLFLSFQFPENINVPFRHGLMKRPVRQKYKTQTKIQNQHSTLIHNKTFTTLIQPSIQHWHHHKINHDHCVSSHHDSGSHAIGICLSNEPNYTP